jgi:hypothetical protein
MEHRVACLGVGATLSGRRCRLWAARLHYQKTYPSCPEANKQAWRGWLRVGAGAAAGAGRPGQLWGPVDLQSPRAALHAGHAPHPAEDWRRSAASSCIQSGSRSGRPGMPSPLQVENENW